MYAKQLGRGAAALGLALLIACNGQAADAPASPRTPVAAAAEGGTDTVATIHGESITLAQVDEAAASGLIEARQQMFEARMQALDQMINERLLDEAAKKRDLTPDELLQQEIEGKAAVPTDADVEAFYTQNQAQIRGSLDEVREPIRQHLMQQHMGERAQAFIDELRKEAGVKVLLEPPRIAVEAADSPRWGKADAPVEIIEFSDFQCPYCTRAAATLDQIKEHYGDKVTIVYRHFPLPNHDRADDAAVASECANDQGRFWEYHDTVFANQRAMSDADLRNHAEAAGLDLAAFDACYTSGKHREKVERDIADGRAVGMSGTPGFYINGRMLGGAQPFEVFKSIIDAELERIGS